MYARCTINNYTVTIARNNTSYGTVSSSSVSVPYGTTYSVSGGTLSFSNGTKVTATSTQVNGYKSSMSWSSSSGTITGNTTITANFARVATTICIQYHTGGSTLASNNPAVKANSSGVIMNNGDTCMHRKTINEVWDLLNVQNKEWIYLDQPHHSPISGREWCTGTAGSGNCYNQQTNYHPNDICNINTSDCTVNLYPNWNIYATSSKKSSYSLPSVCKFSKQKYQFNFNWNVDDSPASGKICYADSSNGSGQQGCYNYTKNEVGKCKNTGYGGAYFENTHPSIPTSKKWHYYRSSAYVYGYVRTTHGKTASRTQG